MASAFCKELLKEGAVSISAGSRPAEHIHPEVVQAMAEVGINLKAYKPQSFQEIGINTADIVVTMGCGEACPVIPSQRHIEWDIPDPIGKSLEEVRVIRDEIKRKVKELVADIREFDRRS